MWHLHRQTQHLVANLRQSSLSEHGRHWSPAAVLVCFVLADARLRSLSDRFKVQKLFFFLAQKPVKMIRIVFN
jgi:hypothetical protein